MIKEMQQLLQEAEPLVANRMYEEVLDLCTRAFNIYKDARDKQYQSVKGHACRKLLLQIAVYVYEICESGDVISHNVIASRYELTLFAEVAAALNMSAQELQQHLIDNESDIDL